MRTKGAKDRKRRVGPHEGEGASTLRALGYLSPKEASKLGRVSGGTIYGWVEKGLLRDVGKLKGHVRYNGVLWILARAVLALRPTPASLARR